MVPAFSNSWSGLVGFSELSPAPFSCPRSCESPAVCLVFSRPRGGGGPGFPVHWSPVSWTRDFFFPSFFFLPFSIPSGWWQGPRAGGGWVPGFLACPPRSLGLSVMRSTSCSFEGRFSWFWGHFWDISPSLTFRSSVWSVNDSPYLLSFF